MKKIAFVSDYFSDEIVGGAENNDSVLIDYLKEYYDIQKIKSASATKTSLEKFDFYIISNFVNLSRECKEYIQTREYIIYEHDHKYVSTRDPSVFVDFKIPDNKKINVDFYINAKKVFVLSNVCHGVLEKNLNLKNIVNIGTSLWSKEQMRTIENNLDKDKRDEFCVIKSNNPIKNQKMSQIWCEKNSKKYQLIGSDSYKDFIEQLSTYSGIVFIPSVLETFSRLVCEAKMLNLQVISNKKKLGFSSEPHFELKGRDLLLETKSRIKKALEKFREEIEAHQERQYIAILSLWKRGEWLEEQVRCLEEQTIPPKEIWLCYGVNEENKNSVSTILLDRFDKVNILEDGGSIYSRFEMCEDLGDIYYFIIDDDMFPNKNYISNCFKFLKHKDDAIICSSGRIFNSDNYFPNTAVGSVQYSNSTMVDIGTNGWFLSYKSISQMNKNHDKKYNNGEDIALSYLNRQNRGVESYVIKQNQFVNSDLYRHKRGLGKESLSHSSNHKEFYKQRNEILMNYKKKKFGLTMSDAKSYWKKRAEQKKQAAVGFISNTLEKQNEEYDEKTGFVIDFIKKISSTEMSTMDYGCGIGRYSQHFSNYIGVDMTEDLVNIAVSNNPNKDFAVVNKAFEIPEDIECERVFTATVLQHNDDDGVDTFIQNCKKVKNLKEFIFYENSQVNGKHMNARDQNRYKEMLEQHFSVDLVGFQSHKVHGEIHTVSLYRIKQ